MDRIHNTRRKTAQRAAEVTANLAPKILGQVEPEAVPQPAIRGRGRGRATVTGRGRGRVIANAKLVDAAPQPELQVLPNLIVVLAVVQQKLEAQDAILKRLHEAMQQAQAQPLLAPHASVLPVP